MGLYVNSWGMVNRTIIDPNYSASGGLLYVVRFTDSLILWRLFGFECLSLLLFEFVNAGSLSKPCFDRLPVCFFIQFSVLPQDLCGMRSLQESDLR